LLRLLRLRHRLLLAAHAGGAYDPPAPYDVSPRPVPDDPLTGAEHLAEIGLRR